MKLKSKILFLCLWLFPVLSWAVTCETRMDITLNKNADGSSSCPATAPAYNLPLPAGCSVDNSSVVGCIALYHICCGSDLKYYNDAVASTTLFSAIDAGNEDAIAQQSFHDFQAASTLACPAGYSYVGEYFYQPRMVTPSYSTNDLSKTDLAVSNVGRIYCVNNTEGFTNNSSVPPPIPGAGQEITVNVDLSSTNQKLEEIRSLISSVNTNTALVNAVKDAIVSGNNNSAAALQAIQDKLNAGIPVTNDSEQTLLTDIKNILQSGGGGVFTNSSGVTNITNNLTVDMAETNGILTEISGLISGLVSAVSGSSTLGGYVDNTASNPAYSSSFFEAGTPTSDSYKAAFSSFTNDMKSTALFSLVGSFFGSVPHGGASTISFNGGRYGVHEYDFSSWGSVLSVLKGLVLVIFAAASMRIIFLKGGS